MINNDETNNQIFFVNIFRLGGMVTLEGQKFHLTLISKIIVGFAISHYGNA